MTRWSLFLQTLSLLHHFLGLYFEVSKFNELVTILQPEDISTRISFDPPLSYAVVLSPRRVIAVDLDDDGDLDLVTLNYHSNDVSVLLNAGNGTFGAAANYGAKKWPFSVAAGDLDGDGDVDLAVANEHPGSVSVLLNVGNGTFMAAVDYPVGRSPSSMAAGDLDGDGDLDLAIAAGDAVAVMSNEGDGTFTGPEPVIGLPSGVVFAGDLDGDGDADLAVETEHDGWVVKLNEGGGSVSSAPVTYSGGHKNSSFTAADLDGDGDVDIATWQSNSPNVLVLLSNGDGTFVRAAYPIGLPYAVAAGDLDGDGDLDLAVADGFGNNILALVNLGNGTFQAPDRPIASIGGEMETGDLDGDGDLDLAILSGPDNSVSVLLNQAIAQTTETATLGHATDLRYAADLVYVADLNARAVFGITPEGDVKVVADSPLLRAPNGMALDRSGKLIVASSGPGTEGSLLSVDPGDGSVDVIVSGLPAYGVFDVVVDRDGNYIFLNRSCQAYNGPGTPCSVNKATPDGVVTTLFTFFQGRAGHPDRPTSIALDSDGNYIVGTENSGLWRLTPSGTSEFISPLTGVHRIAIDEDGNYLVTAGNTPGVIKVTPHGEVSIVVASTKFARLMGIGFGRSEPVSKSLSHLWRGENDCWTIVRNHLDEVKP